MKIALLFLGTTFLFVTACRPAGEMPVRLVDEDYATRQGRRLYSRHCADCHGEKGKGDGLGWAADLPVKPRDLSRELPLAITTTEGPGATQFGYGCPKNHGRLTPAEQADISTFIEKCLYEGN